MPKGSENEPLLVYTMYSILENLARLFFQFVNQMKTKLGIVYKCSLKMVDHRKTVSFKDKMIFIFYQ
jgi:hypothetical protein